MESNLLDAICLRTYAARNKKKMRGKRDRTKYFVNSFQSQWKKKANKTKILIVLFAL